MYKTYTNSRTLLKSKPALSLFLSFLVFVLSTPTQAKTKSVRKVQEINFSELNLKGTIRNPDGAYLVQKRGIKFMPLYDVQKEMDQKIRESVQYVR
jgi:hypothetical protein